jgi:hypothetical protein
VASCSSSSASTLMGYCAPNSIHIQGMHT